MYFDEVETILEGKNSFKYTGGRGNSNIRLAQQEIKTRIENKDYIKKQEIGSLPVQDWKIMLKNNFKEYKKNPKSEVSSSDAIKARSIFNKNEKSESILDNMVNKILKNKLKIGMNPKNKNIQERSQRASEFALAQHKGLVNNNISNLPKRYYFKPTNGTIKPYKGFKGLDNIMKIDNKIYLIERKQTKLTQSIEIELLDFARICNSLKNENLIYTISRDLPMGNNTRNEKKDEMNKWNNFENLIKNKFPKMKVLFANQSEINGMISRYKINYIPEKITVSRKSEVIKDINQTAGAQIVQ